MKNRHIESLIKKAKHYSTKWKRTTVVNSNKNHCHHLYDDKKTISWWDDVSFIHGSQVVTVWWVHPRTEYVDKVEGVAWDKMYPSYPETPFVTIPQYRKLGKNKKRKKIISHRVITDNIVGWHAQLEEVQKQVHLENDFVIRCYSKIEQFKWGKGISLCIPIEVLDENGIDNLARIAREILNRKVTVNQLFPDYVYTKDNYVSENLDRF